MHRSHWENSSVSLSLDYDAFLTRHVCAFLVKNMEVNRSGGGPSQRQKRTRDRVVTGVDARDGEEAGQDSGGGAAGIWVCLHGRWYIIDCRFIRWHVSLSAKHY